MSLRWPASTGPGLGIGEVLERSVAVLVDFPLQLAIQLVAHVRLTSASMPAVMDPRSVADMKP